MANDGLQNHLIALRNKHHDLDKRIEVLYAEHADEKYITPLKKQKLELKEEIIKIEAQIL